MFGTTQSEQQEKRYTIKGDSDGNSNLIYFADALPGTLTSDTAWRIRKVNYDGNGNFTGLSWPNADTGFNYSWDLRTSYTYS